MKVLHRYLFRELIFPFVMGVVVFTFILIMDRIFALSDLIVKYGVSVLAVIKLLLFIMPATFAITIPMACLVAVMVVFSRLKNDNELMAMKAAGISPLPSIGILLIFGLLLTVGMIWFNNTLLPQANYAYRALYFDIVSQRAAIVIREHVFVEDFDGYVFRVGSKNPITAELKDVVVFARGQKSEDAVRTIVAQKGQLISDTQNHRVLLRLENGHMEFAQKQNPLLFSRVNFATTFLDLDINRELMSNRQEVDRSAREMSMKEIKQLIIAESKAGRDTHLLQVEYHKKISIPFACLAFILIGAPVGILAPRSGRYFAYFIGVLLIFMYYIFISLGETFGADGRVNPFLSMWLPNLVLSGFGIYGLIWVVLERPPLFSKKHCQFKGGR